MDVQAGKLQLIPEIKYLKKETDNNLFKRSTDQDLVNRTEASMEDIEEGRTTKLTDFKTEIENWKQSRDTR